jgi:hypothetical protein
MQKKNQQTHQRHVETCSMIHIRRIDKRMTNPNREELTQIGLYGATSSLCNKMNTVKIYTQRP